MCIGRPCKSQIRSDPSAGFEEFRRLVALEQVEQDAQPLAFLAGQPTAAFERRLGVPPGLGEQGAVDVEPGEAEAGGARLAGAEHVALAAEPQVLLGDAESVVGGAQGFDPRLGRLGERSR